MSYVNAQVVLYFTSLITGEKLKTHWQISKKRCFEKYCSCDQACQFPAL